MATPWENNIKKQSKFAERATKCQKLHEGSPAINLHIFQKISTGKPVLYLDNLKIYIRYVRCETAIARLTTHFTYINF
jgi:hypothetical protein